MTWFFICAIWLAVVIWAPVWLKAIAWILLVWEIADAIRRGFAKRKARKQAAEKLRFARAATAPGAGIDRGRL